ncbi:acyl-CoA dehydrogenase family protein [Maricaulis sp.]|uniref:acyl-CoA dehydrogenase family protein n=1 Tax=Maricaulis sp. TaxID=1486257 RepID=UPI003A957773
MDLGITERVRPLIDQVRAMVRDEILPLEDEYHAEVGKAAGGDRFAFTERQVEIRETLKAKARERGLWNFWLTGSDRGYGLTTLEYAYLAEEMGWSFLAPEVFNCSAPDTGNMEVIERYGSTAQKERWLADLLEGKKRSAYLMTEPDVASSDATNIAFSAVLDGDEWVLNGEKYWASGAGDPRCAVYVLMARTEGEEAGRHGRHSQFLVDAATPGIEVLRPMTVFGHDDAPHGHMHIRFTNVRVPKDTIILGRGKGFEISQGRLGPGRIHHCMRAIGQSERAMELMCRRAVSRTAFGQKLARLGANKDIIAERRMAIEQARLLCLKAAWMMDQGDARAAAPYISQIKVIAPRVALETVDEAMQMHGGTGVSQDTPLASMWVGLRTLRFADGPDAVHRMVIARQELKRYVNEAMEG